MPSTSHIPAPWAEFSSNALGLPEERGGGGGGVAIGSAWN